MLNAIRNWVDNPLVQFLFRNTPGQQSIASSIQVDGQDVPLVIAFNRRARRYVLRVRPDGKARVTIPCGGAESTAREFVAKNVDWLRRQLEKVATRPVETAGWFIGTEILFRGQAVRIAADQNDRDSITFADQTIRVAGVDQDHRRQVERHLHRLASIELPTRVFQFAEQHGLRVQRVTVRNQKSRWGSCSRRGTISLNWRLLQAPGFVADYIILHELMHLRQMNHSRKFWREVENVCPDYRVAEQWLKAHGKLLR